MASQLCCLIAPRAGQDGAAGDNSGKNYHTAIESQEPLELTQYALETTLNNGKDCRRINNRPDDDRIGRPQKGRVGNNDSEGKVTIGTTPMDNFGLETTIHQNVSGSCRIEQGLTALVWKSTWKKGEDWTRKKLSNQPEKGGEKCQELIRPTVHTNEENQ